MSTKIVSCLYDGLHGTEFCGANNRGDHYRYSLRSIGNIGCPIHCYTSAKDIDLVRQYLDSHSVDTVKLIVDELENNQFHVAADKIRKSEPETYMHDISWSSRCVEVMWGKFRWLRHEMADMQDDDIVIWMDAGLSHGGIFSRKNNPAMLKYEDPICREAYEDSFQLTGVFNPTLLEKIEAAVVEDKISVFACDTEQHFYPMEFSIEMGIQKEQSNSIIAGLFFGRVKDMRWFCDEFDAMALEVINAGLLFKEEQIMTLIRNKYPEKFDQHSFNTWYHEDWVGSYNPEFHTSFCDIIGRL